VLGADGRVAIKAVALKKPNWRGAERPSVPAGAA